MGPSTDSRYIWAIGGEVANIDGVRGGYVDLDVTLANDCCREMLEPRETVAG